MGRQDNTDPSDPKNRDPYTFQPADDFFTSIPSSGTQQPSAIDFQDSDQLSGGNPNPACSHGRIFRFDNGKFILVQFMRPRIWRIRFSPTFQNASDYSDFNTRTIVQDSLTKLIQVLDVAEQVNWAVEFHKLDPDFFVLQSVVTPTTGAPQIVVQLWIQRNPFRITAVRSVASAGTAANPPSLQQPTLDLSLPIPSAPDRSSAIIWQTKERGLQYQENATILSVEKPNTAKYMGFGEQGGKALYKDRTYMNYFNFDNMRYYNVYGEGPEDDAEPLYHSEPYWIEVNAHPGYMSQLATFIDNYSQVCVDLGKTDQSLTRVATRFNSFQGIFISGDDVGHVIQLYTSIIGRPWLRPRFILGNHQGCYGYDNQWKVLNAATQYRANSFPLDGMHVDVDVQRHYRTFTIDTSSDKFPTPADMFAELRKIGVKCSTNITPVINAIDDGSYSTLESGWIGTGATKNSYNDNYFIKDKRDIDPSAPAAWQQSYLQYGMGTRYFTKPNTDRPDYGDSYDFGANFNSGWPFHGGVDYGGPKGAPGFYPNLNNKDVRIWWGTQYNYLFNTGLEFVWQDMTSPCIAQQYGDMKSLPFRLLLDSDGWPLDPIAKQQKRAIEIWSLFSYNLHRATFKGLHKLDARTGKRNFIIGRGSFAGASRYAGLWTGDNSSTWDFFNISVAQVLALGLAGVSIAGADVGGFESVAGQEWFADPELLIRWYCAYCLLPWFRNHYSAKSGKHFQEPYGYDQYWRANQSSIPADELYIYQSVLPICRYYIRLRYSLLQLLYDAMFENMINGLPIARAMVVTDPLDPSLFASNEWYTRSQYLVRKDLLVAPALLQQKVRSTRKLYLPHPDGWWSMNLRPDGPGVPLQPKVRGGSYIDYDCHISADDAHLPYVTPIYIREGAIIPQIEVRDSVPDRTRPEIPELFNTPANPITIHVYPGKDNDYDMYLDDGVSRESGPNSAYLSTLTDKDGDEAKLLNDAYGDTEAKNVFRQIHIKHTTTRTASETSNWFDTRRVEITTPFAGYDDTNTKRDIGPEYQVVFWHAPETDLSSGPTVTITGTDQGRSVTDQGLKTTTAWVPVDAAVSPVIEVKYNI